MSDTTEPITSNTNDTPPIQDISLNVSYSLIHDASPRNGTLKIKIHNVPENLLKNTEGSRVERTKNPEKNLPFSDDELLLKKIIHIATMRTVNHLQRRFTDILKEMRSVSRDSFEELKVLDYKQLEDILKENSDTKVCVEDEECGICLEKYYIKKTDNKEVKEEQTENDEDLKTKKRTFADHQEDDIIGEITTTTNDKDSTNSNKKRRRGIDSNEPTPDIGETSIENNESSNVEINNTNTENGNNNTEDSSSGEAPIPDEVNNYTHEPVQLTNCVHIFGRNCLYSWCNNNNSCPLCREKISSKNIEYSTEDFNRALQQDELLTSIQYKDLLEEANRDPGDVLRRPFFNTNDDTERSSLFIVSGTNPEVTEGNNANNTNNERPYLTDPRLQTLIERTLTRLSEMLRDRENALRNRNADDTSNPDETADNTGNISFPFSDAMPNRIRIAEMNGTESVNTGRVLFNPVLPQMLSEFLRTGIPQHDTSSTGSHESSTNSQVLTSNTPPSGSSNETTTSSSSGTTSNTEPSESGTRNLRDILRDRVREMMDMVGGSSSSSNNNNGNGESNHENENNATSNNNESSENN
ncbi:hypothetical protein HANVADRAFT_4282 [Hanseniaspora valbyensis NRRL Y-1626]|uniref:RING-type domain-containing protein n=1 Tax=Hanseniaspora valbyensis NRRL Y-1626 TaxID=766949 RepID=A0A1B7T863_9ASCO|nr:hypothetical protein HANVADRAFT_4282 [Hanseniaspora valbyensis NRRL Y-1626]